MSPNKFPCIVYFRSRLLERRANHFAQKQQTAAEAEVVATGYEIVGRFGDEEFAASFAGYMEPRAGWQLALDAAAEKCVTAGRCALIVLRLDGIGEGDPFIPDQKLLGAYSAVDIQIAHSSLRGRTMITSLRSAHRYIKRYIDAERLGRAGQVIELGRTNGAHEIILRRDLQQKTIRAYYANYDDQPLHLKWQAYSKDTGEQTCWPRAVAWEELQIPARSATYLQSFIQGDPEPQIKWWRFKIGDKRRKRVGNIILTAHDLLTRSQALAWYSSDPDDLSTVDFEWEDAPRIETRRLKFRNWTDNDYPQYEAMCKSSEIMRFLGGPQSTADVADDLEYFGEIGRGGPTYWAVESKVDNKLLGFCGVLTIEEMRSPLVGLWEIGWRFALEAQGRGIAIEAAQAVLHSVFEEWHIRRIVCRIHPKNCASRRLAERLGMKENADLNHTPEDEGDELIVYEMTENQYWQTCTQPLDFPTKDRIEWLGSKLEMREFSVER